MLAEDVVLNQVIATRLLARAGYTDVVVAKNGREAVDLVQLDDEVRLVLMDFRMPVLDGLDATRAIRASGQNTVKIVAMTANASEHDRALCVSAGMDDYLSKPVVYKDLLHTLDRYLLAA
ncbi:MAG: CheY-like chemotaxis protein [Kiritimatiellia bacterium]